ncbi:uncharacterized protein [Haliotis cracherodii]|uniref:uncharacterized protein n=1 Tax=Haliotis cracherodii TaxID=6455 RepID=UPI0039EAD5DC
MIHVAIGMVMLSLTSTFGGELEDELLRFDAILHLADAAAMNVKLAALRTCDRCDVPEGDSCFHTIFSKLSWDTAFLQFDLNMMRTRMRNCTVPSYLESEGMDEAGPRHRAPGVGVCPPQHQHNTPLDRLISSDMRYNGSLCDACQDLHTLQMKVHPLTVYRTVTSRHSEDHKALGWHILLGYILFVACVTLWAYHNAGLRTV